MTELQTQTLRLLRRGAATISAIAYQMRRSHRQTRSLINRLKTAKLVETITVLDTCTSTDWGYKTHIQPILVVRLTAQGYAETKTRH